MSALSWAFSIIFLISLSVTAADVEKGKWIPISDGILEKLTAEGKKPGYPGGGGTGGVAVDPVSGDVYVVALDHGIWKSADKGGTFERVDGKAIGGRCETGFALEMDPAGKRLMCFMIYGPSARTLDGGKTWQPSKLSHLDFGSVDWSDPEAKNMIAIKHESGGELATTVDGGVTWKLLGKGFIQVGIFDGGILMATKADGIQRSADGGQTWTKVSDIKPAGGAMHVFKGNGYWTSSAGLLVSKDKGLTWAVQGGAIKAYAGPYFGKDETHIFVGTKEGLQESTDAGATWKLITAPPPGFPAGPVGPNYAFDPANNILYASSMGKQAFKFCR